MLRVWELFDWTGPSCVDVCLKAGRRRRRGGRAGRGASCASATSRSLPGHPRRGRGPARQLPLYCLQEMRDKGTSVTGLEGDGRGTGCGRNGVPSLSCGWSRRLGCGAVSRVKCCHEWLDFENTRGCFCCPSLFGKQRESTPPHPHPQPIYSRSASAF